MKKVKQDGLVAGVPLGGIIPRELQGDPNLVVAEQPSSALAETYRRLASKLERARGGDPARTVVVTSATASEGKTVTSLNLALAMAEERARKVVVVDADLRRPALSRRLNPAARLGLRDVLSKNAPLAHALISLRSSRMAVLPAGEPMSNPLEVLQRESSARLLDELLDQFDRVVFDTPPVVPFSDAAILAAAADVTLLVVRAGRTARPTIERAVRALEGATIAGVVLNDARPTPVDRYYYYYDEYAPERYTGEGSDSKRRGR